MRRQARLEARVRHRGRALRGVGDHVAACRAGDVLGALGPTDAMLVLASSGDTLVSVLLHRGRAKELPAGSRSEAAAGSRRLLRSLARLAREPVPPRVGAVSADIKAMPIRFPRLPDAVELLVVVPPPELAALPWSMLFDGVVVAVAPSATSALAGSRLAATSVAALAGANLAHAVNEAACVESVYQHRREDPRAPVTPAQALDLLTGADVGHLACHGSFRLDSPSFSSLQMSGGELYLHELQQIERPPQLLVFSSCDMGSAAAVGSGESLGPVTAMLGTGVSTVIASPVLVPDHPDVGRLFAAFHTELRDGVRPSSALHAAKLTLESDDPMAAVVSALQCHGRW